MKLVSLSIALAFALCGCTKEQPLSAAIGYHPKSTSTLTTPSCELTIEINCPEGNVTCENVKCSRVDKQTGKMITLTGRTMHTLGADWVTPSRFLGYVFTSGSVTYYLFEDGTFQVARGSEVLVLEMGTWKW
jgi:hypothetical protein